MERDNTIIDYIDVGLQLLGLAAKVAPPLASWLKDVIEGRSDPMSTRVRDILPEESRSAAVLRELGG